MAEISRFFDHIDGDRTYNAEEFAEYFRQILTTGVLDTGDNLRVYVNGTDRVARVKPGQAWIEGYFYKLTEELELSLEEAHGTYDRIDRIVLRLNTNTEARNIKVVVKMGELSLTPEPPALIREGSIYEISLAQILIIHNTTAIPVENVTDERLDSEVCGLANIALTYEEFALKADTGDINDDTLPAELKGKPVVEQIMYVLQHAGKVKSVNGKTGEVVIDVGDIDGLSSKVIESTGSNSNGTYVRFGNGIQICFNVISSRSFGGNNVTELIWTFPATFLNATDYFVIADVGTSSFAFLQLDIIHSLTVSNRLSTRTTFYINNNISADASAVSVYFLAIGRWK